MSCPQRRGNEQLEGTLVEEEGGSVDIFFRELVFCDGDAGDFCGILRILGGCGDVQESSRAEVGNLWSLGQIQCATKFCSASVLRIFFIFVNGWENNQR